MAKIVNQFAHIFIHYYSNKTASACKLFISEPTQNQERLLGRLFGILEINIPSRENTKLINQIINDLEELYYSQAENEIDNFEQYFEDTLKTINEKFTQLIKEKQVLLVGNLNENTVKEKINLSVGVLKDNDLYLSYLNNINIFLIHKTKQDYKMIDIKKIAIGENKDNDQPKSDMPNLFANLISGQVNPGDFLFLANGNFLEYVSQERIQKIVTSLPLHKASEYFKNSLLQHEGNNFAAIIIKNSQTETENLKQPASLTSITELNYTESLTEKLLAPSFWNYFKNLSAAISNLVKPNKKEIEQPQENEEKFNTAEATATEEPAQPATADKNQKISESINNGIKSLKRSFKKLFSKNLFIADKSERLKTWFRLKITFANYWLKKVPSLSKILLAVAGIMLVLFIYSISYLKHQQGQTISQKEYQNLIGQIEDLKNQAESDLIYGDEDKARTEIVQAQNLLTGLPIESKLQKETHDNLNKQIERIIAKLRHITIIEEPVLIADLPAQQENSIDVQNLIFQNNNLIAFDSLNNSNYVINIDSREIKSYPSNLSDIGSIVRVKIIGDKILGYHSNNGMFQYRDNKYSSFTVMLNPQGKLADFSSYNDRLYTLDYINNQIYRQSKTDTGYGQSSPWLKQAQDLKNIIALSIDVNIWLLDKTGKLLKFNKGLQQNFEFKNVEPQLEAPNGLFTDERTEYIYILEAKNKRIVVIDKSGNLVTQYFSEAFDNLRDFIVVENEKKSFVISDNKIYFFNLTHL